MGKSGNWKIGRKLTGFSVGGPLITAISIGEL